MIGVIYPVIVLIVFVSLPARKRAILPRNFNCFRRHTNRLSAIFRKLQSPFRVRVVAAHSRRNTVG